MIDILHVSKTYPKQQVKAVDDVSLHIDSGEFFGLLGPNGAGKTTLIRILVTLLLPTSGEVQINQQVLTRKRADLKKKLSIITQENSLRYDMTLDQVMEWQARLYHIPLAVGLPTPYSTCDHAGAPGGIVGFLWSDRAQEKDGAQAFGRYEAQTYALPRTFDGP